MGKIEDAYQDGYRAGYHEGIKEGRRLMGANVQKNPGVAGNANRTGQNKKQIPHQVHSLAKESK